MAERPDLRQIAAALRESLDSLERDALVDVLTYVLNEYVVEGPPPLAAVEVERLDDLAGLSLAGLVSALQTRLDTPGLELFRVEGDEVRVQTGQGWVALTPGRAAAAASPAERGAPAPGSPSSPPARDARAEGRAGARFIEQPMTRPAAPVPANSQAPGAAPTGRSAADEAVARGRGDLIGGERGVVTAPAPRPRGVSISGRPTASPAPADPAPPRSTQPPASPPAPPSAAEPPAASPSSDRKEDDASIRFSLLELD